MLGWKIGKVTVTRVVELETTSIGGFLLPQAKPEVVKEIAWLEPHFLDEAGKLRISVHSFVVESLGQRILVDTCIGNDKERRYPPWNRMSGPYLAELGRAGVSRNAVDTVLCTHLHVDHVGWNTTLSGERWVPTFPNARYLFGRREWEYWKDLPEEEFGPVITDSVRPIVEAGLADLVETDHRLNDEVWLEPTPGHTPGHVSVRIRSQGEEGVITGDLLHHPCQLVHPEWSASLDYDPEQSRATRLDFLRRYADRPVLVLGSHFAAPTAGRIVADGDHYRLDF